MKNTFTQPKAVVAMIHVGALPGTPRCSESLDAIVERARGEARLYAAAGVDALMIENMHDLPYLKGEVGPEIVAGMTAVGVAVTQACAGVRDGDLAPAAQNTGSKLPVAHGDQNTGGKPPVAPGAPLPLGVQVLAAANREALAVALACGASFVRVENFAYAHVADEGLMPTAEAGPLLRYRKQIGGEHIRIIADVKKKHSSHAITADVSLAETARTAEFCGADAIVVTGAATGEPTAPADVAAVKQAVSVPVCIGSGLTPTNLPELWPHADVFIVGSYFKKDGLWSNEVDADRVAEFMRVVAELRGRS